MTHIIVDPGHGGTDSGAVGTVTGLGTIYEKNLNLMFAQAVKAGLDGVRYSTTMTRNSDVTKNSTTKVNEINGWSGYYDALISIHFNSGSSTLDQTQTYYAQTRSGDKTFADRVRQYVYSDLPVSSSVTRDDTYTSEGSIWMLRGPSNHVGYRVLCEVQFLSNTAAMDKLNYPLQDAAIDFGRAVARACAYTWG